MIQSLLDSDALPDNDLRAMVNLIDKDKASSSSSSIYFEVTMVVLYCRLDSDIEYSCH